MTSAGERSVRTISRIDCCAKMGRKSVFFAGRDVAGRGEAEAVAKTEGLLQTDDGGLWAASFSLFRFLALRGSQVWPSIAADV